MSPAWETRTVLTAPRRAERALQGVLRSPEAWVGVALIGQGAGGYAVEVSPSGAGRSVARGSWGSCGRALGVRPFDAVSPSVPSESRRCTRGGPHEGQGTSVTCQRVPVPQSTDDTLSTRCAIFEDDSLEWRNGTAGAL